MQHNSRIYKITYSAVLIALGLVLPQFTHMIGGAGAGSIFLPIHIPVFIAGLCIGSTCGVAVAVILPLLSFLLSGMPSIAILPYMIIELTTYGLVCGLMSKKTNNTMLSIVVAQVSGRAVYIIIVAISLLIGASSFVSLSVVFVSMLNSCAGVVIQLAILPILVNAFRRINVYENKRISCRVN